MNSVHKDEGVQSNKPKKVVSIVSTHQQMFDKPLRQQFLLKSEKQV